MIRLKGGKKEEKQAATTSPGGVAMVRLVVVLPPRLVRMLLAGIMDKSTRPASGADQCLKSRASFGSDHLQPDQVSSGAAHEGRLVCWAPPKPTGRPNCRRKLCRRVAAPAQSRKADRRQRRHVLPFSRLICSRRPVDVHLLELAVKVYGISCQL